MNDYTGGKPWKIAKRQHIMETGYQLFSERGIGAVTMPEVAEAASVGRATLYRYFTSKLDLVVAIGAWKWEEYITERNANITPEAFAKLTGAEYLQHYLDSFIDLYQFHSDILRFNYDFNSFLRFESATEEQQEDYLRMISALHDLFHVFYERGEKDGTINTDISEESMFSSSFHIMLAAATRYAVGLVYISEKADPKSELIMLKDLLLSQYVGKQA